jgi:hypothetical protein
MCGDDGGDGIEVIFRIDGSDDEITHAVVIDELEQRFTREADESLLQFQMRVRAAAAGRSICWNGLPNPPSDSDWAMIIAAGFSHSSSLTVVMRRRLRLYIEHRVPPVAG